MAPQSERGTAIFGAATQDVILAASSSSHHHLLPLLSLAVFLSPPLHKRSKIVPVVLNFSLCSLLKASECLTLSLFEAQPTSQFLSCSTAFFFPSPLFFFFFFKGHTLRRA